MRGIPHAPVAEPGEDQAGLDAHRSASSHHRVALQRTPHGFNPISEPCIANL